VAEPDIGSGGQKSKIFLGGKFKKKFFNISIFFIFLKIYIITVRRGGGPLPLTGAAPDYGLINLLRVHFICIGCFLPTHNISAFQILRLFMLPMLA
jgi:hypothetical protein